MHLESKILVHRTPQEVWDYLGDYSNVPQWDRGVGSVRSHSETPPGVGFEFDTLGKPRKDDPEGQRDRMSYRISEANPTKGCTIQLTSSDGKARYFKKSEWHFRVDPSPEGASVICAVDFKLHLRYLLLAPFLFIMRKGIDRDLQSLKSALENG
jgi:Polyketide cyclase / dehydrase and lipid transport